MSTSDLLRILDQPTAVHRLANGLTVVVRERHLSPVVALVTHVRAGYLDESDGLVGISHVLEHMYFKGTSRRGPGEIARETKDAGGYLNASTSYGHTRYYTVLPARALQQGMDVQADALRDSLIDDDELRRELRVIIEEAKRKRDTPTAYARETMYGALFDTHRMRRWRIGTEAQLETYDRDAVHGFYRRWYQPESIVVAIVGAVDADEALALAENHYGDLPAGRGPSEPAPAEPARQDFRYRPVTGEVSRTYLEAGWRGVALDDADSPVFDMLATVLGGGRASRLYRDVREPGHALSVSASSYGTRDIGVFGVSAEATPGASLQALRAVGKSLNRVRDHGVHGEELVRARRLLRARALRQLETVEGQAGFLADWQARGDWRSGATWLTHALEADADALVALAQTRLRPELATVVLYAPKNGMPPTETEVRAALASTSSSTTVSVESPPAIPGSGPATFERAEDGVRIYQAERARIAVQRMDSGLATLAIAFPGGTVEETPDVAGYTALALRLTTRGTMRRDADDIARATESLGGLVHAQAGDDRFEWRITVPAAEVLPALSLLGEVAFEASFPEDVTQRELHIALQDVARIRDDMYAWPLTLMLHAAWRDHPYGFSIETLETALGGADANGLRAWHAARIRRMPWIVVTGDVDADEVASAAAALPMPGGASDVVAESPEWPLQRVESSAALDRAQTGIAIGMAGPARQDDDRYALSLAGAALSGLGGRVFEELRSRRSLAYTVSLRTMARREAGAFVGYLATSPDREDEARTELLAEIARVATHGVEEADLERARRYAVGTWDIRRQTTAAVASDLVGALVLGRGLHELREYRDRILAVTGDSVRNAARRWLDPDRTAIGVVRGRA